MNEGIKYNPERESKLPYFDMDYEKLTDNNGVKVIPAIILNAKDGNLLMVGFMNKEAYEASREIGQVVFWSRTRKELWLKGRNSGERLVIDRWVKDCDNDTLKIYANPLGPVCHRPGKFTCFEE